MPARILPIAILLGSLCLAVAGCVNLGASASPATRFYVLESAVAASPPPPVADAAEIVTIGVQSVEIPAYLDRPQLVTRVTGNTLQINEFDRWAEPLGEAIGRVIAENLHALTEALPGYRLASSPARNAALRLTVKVLRFEADEAGRVTLKAAWRVSAADDGVSLLERIGTHTLTATSDRPGEVVRSMSLALAALSEELMLALADVTPR
ncbi:MAG: PqiC family protein [Desulfosarcinaceae bacterium]|nr:PqiC family protein [Desulfosarcinaceae bacterium]